MGTTYERAKGIVFIASDNATFMAGSAVARPAAAGGARLRGACSRAPPTRCRGRGSPSAGRRSTDVGIWLGRKQREQRAHHLKKEAVSMTEIILHHYEISP